MSGSRGRGLLPVAALTAGALVCWLAGAATGALSAQAGATRAELSATAVVRTSVAAGTWEAHPARSRPTPTATQAPTPIDEASQTPTETPTETPTDPPSSSSSS